MTPTETYLSMDPRERDALVLQRLFGWKWMRDKSRSRCALCAPLPMGVALPDWTEEKSIPPDDQRFRDWEKNSITFEPIPRPGTDPAAALEVVEELRKLGWSFECFSQVTGGWACGVAKRIVPYVGKLHFESPTFPIGVAVAALVATEPEAAHA